MEITKQKLLENKTAIVTGGSRGIGKAIAERFAQEGCNLMLAARTKSELVKSAKEIQEKYSSNVIFYPTDISNEDDVQRMVEATTVEFGTVDILINNAGIIGPMGEISDVDNTDFFNTFKNNVGGTIFCVKAVLPLMKARKSGWIINLSGGGALFPMPYYDAYSVSKASIVRLTENFAIEFEDHNIFVAAIAPGAVNTKMFDEQLEADKSAIGEKNWQMLQERLESGGDSISKAPELALFLVSEFRREFNGKVISAIWDDWKKISNNKDIITDSDVYTMRRIIPKDKDIDLS